jgi:plastocyanin
MRPKTAPLPLLLALLLLIVPLLMAGSRSRPIPLSGRSDVGRIAGTVEISSVLTARRPRFRIYADAGPGSVPPAPRNDLASELRNVVVYLQSDRGVTLASAPSDRSDSLMRATMAQADERFEPHILPVLQGARVDFPNRDDVYHNVFSLSSARTFDLGRYPKGSSKSVTFPRTGVVQVFCHIHSDMSAMVLVLANRYFTAPDAGSRYAIENVPPGEYTVVGWHERTRPVAHRVRVTAGQTTEINFSLPLEQRPTER